MAPRKAAMQNVGGPFTDTVATQFASPAKDSFTPDWDKYAAGQQGMSRNKQRAAMGKKLTPKGCGTLTSKR